MQPGFVDFQNFAQIFSFGSGGATFEAMEFQKPHQVGFLQGCDTGLRKQPGLDEARISCPEFSLFSRSIKFLLISRICKSYVYILRGPGSL